MKTSRLIVLLICSIFSFPVFSQIDLKLQLMQGGTKWGVYAKPQPGTNPSSNTITGSAQITLVTPLNFPIVDLISVSGTWANNATVHGPIENPTKSYYSFGLTNSELPPIVYSQNDPTLFFTFKRTPSTCPISLNLFENGVDPFELPNSVSSNPGNELTIFDPIMGAIYVYSGNYSPFAWDCNDCDNDGIVNAFEDTNGDGEWTPGVDVSDLCNGQGNGCTEITAVQLSCAGGGNACGNNPSGPISLTATITGGQAPFTLKYSNGSTVSTITNYQSGAAFQVPATNGAVYTVTEVKGADGCVATNATGQISVSINSSLQFITQPSNISVCPTESAAFTACASASNGSLNIRWEYSENQGTTWQPVDFNSGIFTESTMSSGCKTLNVNLVLGKNGHLFRAVAEGSNASPITSQSAVLNVQGPLQVTANPANASVCAGDPAVFSANFSNIGSGNITYEWEISHDGGATWLDAAQSANILGANTPTLTINSVQASNSGDLFRLRGRVGNCAFTNSTPATLTVGAAGCEGNLVFTTQPTNVTVCPSESASFVACATANNTSLDLKWEHSADQGSTWQAIDIAGGIFTESALSNGCKTLLANNTAGLNGHLFRAVATGDNAAAATSVAAELKVQGPVEILAVVSPVTVCRGSEACFEVQATAQATDQITYQWQELTNGTWADIVGATSSLLCLSNTEGRNGYCLRAKVGLAGCPETVTSVQACLIVGDKAVFTQQPLNTTKCYGDAAKLTANAAIADGYAGQIDYRWQSSVDGGQNWLDIDNSSQYDGVFGNELTIADPSSTINHLFRLSASTGICEATYSDAASVTVDGPVAFIEQPLGLTACTGSEVSFTAAANNLGAGTTQLQWQFNDGSNWFNIAEGNNHAGVQTTALTVQTTAISGQYRLGATVGTCPVVYSDAAALTVEAPINFSAQPANAVACPDEPVSISAAVNGGSSLQVQWQMSLDGTVWADIAEGGNFSGTNTATLSIAAAVGLDGTMFRLWAASLVCTEISATAMLTLDDEATCNPAPGNQDCIQLSIKLLDNKTGWGVWAKASNDFTESPYQLPTSGKITIVSPMGFSFQQLTSTAGGKWKPGKVSLSPSEDPGKIYIEFNLTPNENFLNLQPGGEIMLFRFKKAGPCPASLELMEDIIPTGFYENQFTGFGAGLADNATVPFHFCGNYAQGDWDCPANWTLMAPTNDNDIEQGNNIDLDPSAVMVDFNAEKEVEATYFGVSPNPTTGELTVAFDENIAEQTATLQLWSLQGQLLLTERADGSNSHRLDLGQYTPGTYFLTLEVDGKLVQREKVIVQ